MHYNLCIFICIVHQQNLDQFHLYMECNSKFFFAKRPIEVLLTACHASSVMNSVHKLTLLYLNIQIEVLSLSHLPLRDIRVRLQIDKLSHVHAALTTAHSTAPFKSLDTKCQTE